ncbi:chemotaxis protein CheW [Natronolimnohabitans innermongolicus]|uniref:CheW protein n=1 Tax=Natronolimnohabitans innermongolicus JCM 12255 TaxID=1227499 RepID=L9WLG9_9EURY|nr:chemotaxis protein CheW [Natronolimnohabitans innermongolicus]ELY49198.1 CheW protein [Natronolimnohabitans innermongolicus JCM 12255]
MGVTLQNHDEEREQNREQEHEQPQTQTQTQTQTQDQAFDSDDAHVLEFDLAGNRYCVEIGYIAEIVNAAEITSIPNTPAHVEGVMDLRGETTKIVNLKTMFDLEDRSHGNRIIVFKRKRGADERIGWLADEVQQVHTLDPETVDTGVDSTGIAGIVRREDRFVVWIDPTDVWI